VSAIISGVVMLGVPVIGLIDGSARSYLPFIAIVALVVGFVRVFSWWFIAGRTMIVVSSEVVIRSRFRTIRFRLEDIDSAVISPGEWRPEWSRWAVHPEVILELRDGRRISRPLLLDSKGMLREGPRLHAAFVHAARKPDEGAEKELS